ncbi:hypothetical protein [Moorena sp. SIO3B2]|uniref:hypothetical protein n=1 Tax=Moorena sp. SIO3B2 TaxID=2607827 RepID=UPI00257EED6C|nr:hypothetical protein [Moorena sp. SIO3B2]
MALEFSQELKGICPPYKLKTFCLLSKKNSLFPIPCSLLPAPCSLLPIPCSLLPIPCSLLPDA